MLSLLVLSVLVAFCRGLGTTDCGRTPIAPELGAGDRIVGGREAVPGSWPWHAGLHTSPYFDSIYFCGGALIDDQHVLTAAHCVAARNSMATAIHLGSHQRQARDDSEVNVEVEHMCMHRDPLKDIAVIKLKEKVEFSDSIQPACLPQDGDVLSENTTVYSTGWGLTDGWDPESHSDELMQAELEVLSHERCNRDFRPPDKPAPNHVICTRRVHGSVCKSDSGGPLVRRSDDGRWILEGVVNLGPKICTVANRAILFSSTTRFTPWLREYESVEDNPEQLSRFCDLAPNVTRLFLDSTIGLIS